MFSLLHVRVHDILPAVVALLALAAFGLAHDGYAGVARAQTPPPYDDFNNREHWYGDWFPMDRTYVTAGATLEQGESAPCASIGSTLWFEFMPDRNGRLFVDTTGSDFDAVLAVYTWDTTGDFLPSPPGAKLVPVGCSDATPGADANFSFEIRRHTQYLIQVGGKAGASGNARVRATCDCSPPNDDFPPDHGLYANPYQPETTVAANTTLATTQANEPQPCAGIGATVWYSMYIDPSSSIAIDTAGSGFDTVVAVYRYRDGYEWPADFSDLTLVACEDDGASPASVTVGAASGGEYAIQVGGAAGARGNLTVTARCDPTCPPYNDNSANADWWEPPADACCFFTDGATLEEGEPRPCGNIGATVWYRVTVRGDARLVIDTGQSDFDTALAVYEPAAFSPPGSSDVIECETTTAAGRARLEFNATANVTYLLQVGGRGGTTGQLGFTIDCEPAPCPPPNDSIVSPYGFDRPYGEPYEDVYDVRGATVEDREPTDCGNMSHTTWWVLDMYQGRSSIRFLLDTANSTFETAIAVYEAPLVYSPDGSLGASFDHLELIECDFQGEGTRAVARFNAVAGEAGTRYLVQIGGRGGASGELHLTIDCDGGCPPENDNMAQAWYPPFGFDQTTDTRGATIEPGEPQPCGNVGKTIWYRMDGPAAGDYLIKTAGSAMPTAIAVYRNDGFSPPGGLVSVGCSTTGAMALRADGNYVYYIQIGGVDGAGGSLVTRVDCVAGCQATSPPGGAIPGAGVVGPDTGSGGYLPAGRHD